MRVLLALLALAWASSAWATIPYTSNNPSTGFDPTTAGSLPSGWINVLGGAWKVNTTPATFTSHTHTFSDSGNTNGSVALETGIGTLTDVELTASENIIGTNGSTFERTECELMVRSDVGAQNYYYFGMYSAGDGANIQLVINKVVSGSGANIANTAVPLAGANIKMNLRVQIIGTTLKMKVWLDGSAEPSSWTLTGTDSTFSSGYVGVQNDFYISSGPGSVTDFVVNNTPSGAATSISVLTPTTQLAAGGTVSGTYSGTAPTGLNIAIDGATSYSGVSSPTVSGGNFSFAMPNLTAGYHQFNLQSAGATTITGATTAFEGTASAAVSHMLSSAGAGQ